VEEERDQSLPSLGCSEGERRLSEWEGACTSMRILGYAMPWGKPDVPLLRTFGSRGLPQAFDRRRVDVARSSLDPKRMYMFGRWFIPHEQF
jgi:hypothetical protein